MAGLRRPVLLLGAIWLLGVIALGAVVWFESRVDATRRAQVVIVQMRNEQGALLAIAFNPATADTAHVPGPEQTTQQMNGAKGVYRAVLRRSGDDDDDDGAAADDAAARTQPGRN